MKAKTDIRGYSGPWKQGLLTRSLGSSTCSRRCPTRSNAIDHPLRRTSSAAAGTSPAPSQLSVSRTALQSSLGPEKQQSSSVGHNHSSFTSVELLSSWEAEPPLWPPPEASTPPPATASPLKQVIPGYATAKGYLKNELQDRFVVEPQFAPGSLSSSPAKGSPPPPCVFTAVLDGHSGTLSAEIGTEGIKRLISKDQTLWNTLGSSPCSALDEEEQAVIRQCFKNAYAQVDDEILAAAQATGRIDGSTAVALLQYGLRLLVANAGDSRAVLGRGRDAIRLSRDHKPNLKSEKIRIESHGGIVAVVRGTWRVVLPQPDGQGAKVCAVSRALGDHDFKAHKLMSNEPDVTTILLQPRMDHFTILASDGLWGSVTDADAVELVHSVLAEYETMSGISRQAVATAAARMLLKLAQDKGSVDDITVVVNLYEWY